MLTASKCNMIKQFILLPLIALFIYLIQKRLNHLTYPEMALEVELSPDDSSSFARPDLAVVRSLHISLEVDFARHIFAGKVKLNINKVNDTIKELILDVKKLQIFSITDSLTGNDLPFTVSDMYRDIGSKLSIDIGQCDRSTDIVILYETSPSAAGLQWLTPIQTSGGKHPYVFSQGQPTEMRSIVPCQDTPAVKTPFTADIRAPKELMVLMGAHRVNTPVDLLDGTRLHQFQQTVPIPSYLIAIAIGRLESRRIGPRSEVWAEKEIIEKCVYEFEETEQMLTIAESICGPYVWGIYDLLVLPPAFAYGGMENPCLTFVTPALLAGDRSLADVIAHEISHSWTGNLVTNANFEHFWLNEGFTVFVERKIIGRMHGAEIQDFAAIIGLSDLRDKIQTLGETHPFTQLVPKLRGHHPDEAFSEVPYEKGQLFLRFLEQNVGGPDIFERFLRVYLDKYKYKSIKTDVFETEFKTSFPDVAIDWHAWLHNPGLPVELPKFDMTLSNKCNEMRDHVLNFNTSPSSAHRLSLLEFKDIPTMQIKQLLSLLLEEEAITVVTLEYLDSLFNFANRNPEVKFRWIRLCLRSRWTNQVPMALNFVNGLGRMKYLNPIYKELYDWEEVRGEAIENYKAHKDVLQVVAQKGIERILHFCNCPILGGE